jgi:hypothetical protein
VERRYELDRKLRSIAMLRPQHPAALTREEAMALVEELAAMEERLRRAREALRALLGELDVEPRR